MLRWFRHTVLSVAVFSAMFAYGAHGKEKPSKNDKAIYEVFEPPTAENDPRNKNKATSQSHEQVTDHGAEAVHDATSDTAVPAAHGAQTGLEHEAGSGEPHIDQAHDNTVPDEISAPAMGTTDYPVGDELDELQPYKLIRSLQFVQDSVVHGDHSALEMQRYLIGVIDSRLRTADQTVFDNPRNVDAALIYAMSGGNPETLEILAVKDKFGNFDDEIVTLLRAYLNGRLTKKMKALDDLVKLYRDTELGPYLALVAANVEASQNENETALTLFDWARLTSPGTLVEEAALRRSLFIAVNNGMIDKALAYAENYARRFIQSPYAAQFAGLLVDLVVNNYEKVGEARLKSLLLVMDTPRKREVYLRIARKAAIKGVRGLAIFAAAQAEELSSPDDVTPRAMADLYSGMASVPSESVGAALEDLGSIAENQLSARDRALRLAAQLVASEIVREPDPDSFRQGLSPMMDSTSMANPAADTTKIDLLEAAAKKKSSEEDKAFTGFVSDTKQKLKNIDKMLGVSSEDQGS